MRRVSRVVAYLLVAVLAAVASGCARGGAAGVPPELARARELFEAGDFLAARSAFQEVREADPGSVEALLGEARCLHQLHLYDEAIAAYEEVLARAPGHGLAWEGYLGALTWGGILEGDRRRLDRALERGAEALDRAPERPEIYATLRTAAGELNDLSRHVAVLESVAAGGIASPVLGVELARARAEAAGRQGPAAAAAVLVDLKRSLDAVEAGTVDSAEATVGELYALAVGHDLLGQGEPSTRALEALEERPDGDRLARPLRYRQFLDQWSAAARQEDPAARLDVVERWKPRFTPDWHAGVDRYRAISGMELDALLEKMGAEVEPREEDVRRLLALVDDLARRDTWGGAAVHVEAADALLHAPGHRHDALRVARQGHERLAAGEPGLVHPGTLGAAREEARRAAMAALQRIAGEALVGLDRLAEAGEALTEAVALYPDGPGHAALGDLLARRGRDAAAFDAYVAALARGFPGDPGAAERVRAALSALASRLERSPADVAAAVTAATEAFAEEAVRDLVADPLDREIADFELLDMAGDRWRLSELRGRVVVLNYWATWCGPCHAELPHWQRLVHGYDGADDVVLLAVSTDADPAVARRWIEEQGYTFPVLFARGTAADLRITAIPTALWIGKEGRIQYRTEGYAGEERFMEEMRVRIEHLRGSEPVSGAGGDGRGR